MNNQEMNSQELHDLVALKELHKGKGVIATILGIISLLGCLGPISFICGIIAIFVGANARKKSKKTTGTAGMVMGIIGVVLSILGTILIIAMMAGIMAPQAAQYADKTAVANDTAVCDTVKTAISVALADPSSYEDEDSVEFIEYYSDGYYYDIDVIFEDDCEFAESVKSMLGYDSYADLCEDLNSSEAYTVEFCIEDDEVSTRIPGTDIESY